MVASFFVVGAPTVQAIKEMRGLLPTDVEWIGRPIVVGFPVPLVVWQSFRSPTLDAATVLLERGATAVARTRDGNVRVFRSGDRTIYLAAYDGIPRIELQLAAACHPLAVPFPPTADEVFLQFGGTPGRAAETASAGLDFEMDPCPRSGYWAVKSDVRAALFTGFAEQRITYRVTATGEAAGTAVDLGIGLPRGYLRSGTISGLTWLTDGMWHSFEGSGLTDREMVATACRSMRLRILCP